MTRRAPLLLVVALLGLAVVLVLVLLVPRSEDEGSEPAAGTGAAAPAPAAATPAAPILPDTGPTDDPADAPRPMAADLPEAAEPTVVTLRAIDRAGVPVAGAAVDTHRLQGEGIVRTRTRLGAGGRADAEGRVRITGLPVGSTLGLQVRSPDHAPAVRETFVVEAGRTLDLGDVVLDPGFPLTGRVTDVAGTPIEGAEVELAEMGFLQGGDPAPTLVLTDADGRYRVEHLGSRQYAVEARAAGYAADASVLSLMLGGPVSGQTQDFRLAEADSRLGGVVLGPDDMPVPGCTLAASRRDPQYRTYTSLETVADAEGRFDFPAVASGAFQIDLRSSSHYLPHPAHVESGRGDVVLRAQRALRVLGTLVCDGETPRRFDVRILPDGPSGAGLLPGRELTQHVAAADPPGSFVVDGLRPGGYRFEVTAEGWAVTTSADVIVGQDGGDAELLLRLLRGGTITGRVDPPDPALAAELRGADYDPALAVESLFPTPPLHALVARTTGDGGFRLEHVPSGDYTLSLRGGDRPPVHVRGLHIEDGATLDVGTLVRPVGGTLYGNVFGPDGRPRASVRVTATSPGHHQEAVTDAQGMFRMTSLPEGDYEVVAVPANLWEALRFEARTRATVRAREEQPVLLEMAERAQMPR